MKKFKILCRKFKIPILPRGGNFQFSARGERYVYLKKTHPGVNFTTPTCNMPLRGTLHVLFHPGVNFTPGLSSPLSLVNLIFLYTCSTEVKSHPYLYFAPVLKTRAKLPPRGNSA